MVRRKDKTTENILMSLQRVERKLDHLYSAVSPGSTSASSEPDLACHIVQAPGQTPPQPPVSQYQVAANRNTTHYKRLTGAHRVLLWPAIYNKLLTEGKKAADELRGVWSEGADWFIQQEIEKHPEPLPSGRELHSYPAPATPDSATSTASPRVFFHELNQQNMTHYADQYFNTYNMIYPLLDYDSFMRHIMSKVLGDGFGDTCNLSVIALLVFALGKVAIEGTFGEPIAMIKGEPSGLRGGSAAIPAALDIFNEARKRLGYVQSQCSLENAQILLLTA